jgi:hypothetical protein
MVLSIRALSWSKPLTQETLKPFEIQLACEKTEPGSRLSKLSWCRSWAKLLRAIKLININEGSARIFIGV